MANVVSSEAVPSLDYLSSAFDPQVTTLVLLKLDMNTFSDAGSNSQPFCKTKVHSIIFLLYKQKNTWTLEHIQKITLAVLLFAHSPI